MATLVVFVVLVATASALVFTQSRLLRENLDESLVGAADSLEALVVSGTMPALLPRLGDEDSVAQAVTNTGQVIAATPNVEGLPPIAKEPPAGQQQIMRTVQRLPTDNSRFRTISRVVAGPDGPVTLHIGATMADIRDAITVLVSALLVVVPLAVSLLAALIWFALGRSLGPVEAIRAEVAEIGAKELHRRVPQPKGDDEIGRLARTMNEMLERVERAVQRQQQFVADASHELRSPLTRMRAELEVDAAHPETADLAATQHSLYEETLGLQRLVEDLLHLARSDGNSANGTAPITKRPTTKTLVDLDELVERQAVRVRAMGRVAIEISEVHAVQTRGDPAELSRAIANIAENAARHADTTVSFSVTQIGATAILTVTDDGPGIHPDFHEHVFERFTRLEDHRSTATGGSGLGLAIARDIAERNGGTLTIDPSVMTGARLVLTLQAS